LTCCRYSYPMHQNRTHWKERFESNEPAQSTRSYGLSITLRDGSKFKSLLNHHDRYLGSEQRGNLK
jgi:hypothetical protein